MAAMVYTGCKKDTSTVVNITPSDLTAINNQLKGTWLFPSESQDVVDNSGKVLSGAQYSAAPALQFDGNSKVIIYQDINTKLNGTYSLSTKNGMIYLDLLSPDGTDVTYQVILVNSQTLKLVNSQPYDFSIGSNTVSALSQTNLQLLRQSSADVTGNLVRVSVQSDSVYSVSVYVTHTKGADTAVFLDSKQNTSGNYTYAFPAKSGDQLTVQVTGDYTNTFFYAYYNGIPMAGNIGYDAGAFETTTGWIVP